MTRAGRIYLKIGCVLVILLVLLLWMDQKSRAEQTEKENTLQKYLAGKIEESILYHFVPYFEYRRKYLQTDGGQTEGREGDDAKPDDVMTMDMLQAKEGKPDTGIIWHLALPIGQESDVLGEDEDLSGGQTAEGEMETAEGQNGTEGNSSFFTGLQKQQKIEWEQYEDFQHFVNRFYIVDASTRIEPELLDFHKLLDRDMRIEKNGDGPQILIYHTHSQEGFADSVPGDDSTGIMAVGRRLTEILEQEYGYSVYYHTGRYDVETRDNAYSRSLTDVQEILRQYPTIEVILDLHRDDMASNVHLVTEVDGKPTAKFMFFNGVSRTKKNGEISYLYNPYLEDNLAFSFQAKVLAEEYFPDLTRKNYLHAYRYNLHLLPRSMLIEIGAQNNTLEEELNACEPLAKILDLVLGGEG